MAHTAFLEQLFRAHLADLRSVDSEYSDAFVCPICFRSFPIAAIYNEELTDGHAWPDYIREKSSSALAKSQRVLLCKRCNSKAGSRGDKQMQLLERIKDGEKEGQLYDERYIEIIRTPGQKPMYLRAKIIQTGELTSRISFERDKDHKQWKRNDPKMREELLFLIAQGERFSMIVPPPKGFDSNLARVGWLTSAYLLAFYTFGYRYIFHKSLDAIREYILASFDEEAMKKLPFPNSDVISVRACDEHYYNDPRIELDIPVDGNLPIHIEVSFLGYRVALPFPVVPEILSEVIRTKSPDFEERRSELTGQDASFRVPVSCTKLDSHTCVWDYIMGKPIPEL